MAETPPEPLWPGEAVDELPTADGLPHQERTRGRRGRLESVRLEEAPSLEPVQAETPKDDDPDGRQEGEDIHHARLQTNLLVYFNLSRRQLTRPDVVRQTVVHRERVGVRLRPLRLREGLDPLDAEDPIVEPPHLALLDHDLFLAGPAEAFLLEPVEHWWSRDVECDV